jgi:hypothetical protein
VADFASDPLAWRPVKAPSLAEFEALAGEVFRRSAEEIPQCQEKADRLFQPFFDRGKRPG